MSRYRKIEVRTWSDERFRNLSPMPPSGQGLWFFLLTGPHTSPIPGLFRAGRAAMAEELDWDIEAFDEAFAEVSRSGMAKADFKARLVWLPNALKHNRPESPNVVRSWRSELDLLPECELKNEAIEAIRKGLQTLGPSYVAAFEEVISKEVKKDSGKASGKPSTKPSAKATPNQEQEQEQEQEETSASAAPTADTAGEETKTKPASKPAITFDRFLADCRAAKEKPLPESDPVFAWAEKAGIDLDFLRLAWVEFKSRYTGPKKAKRYRDWRMVFGNAVRDNWFRLWYCDESGVCKLTNQGRLIAQTHREAA